MLPIGKFDEKKEINEKGKVVVTQEFQEEHVLLDDWVFVEGKWHRVTKIRQQTTNELMYYTDGELVHIMSHDDLSKMHKKLSSENPISLNKLKKKMPKSKG